MVGLALVALNNSKLLSRSSFIVFKISPLTNAQHLSRPNNPKIITHLIFVKTKQIALFHSFLFIFFSLCINFSEADGSHLDPSGFPGFSL